MITETGIFVPAHIQSYVRVLGEARAFDFFMAFGGSEVYFPENPTEQSAIVQLIGVDAARLLARTGEPKRRVPIAREWLVQVLRSRGESVAGIARRLHCSDVTVRRALQSAAARRHRFEAQARQYSLLL